jgi:hypothetical protein
MSSLTTDSNRDVVENGNIEKLHLDLHKTVNEMQSQHGIVPHQDYDQYRQYCTRKLGRLRRNTDLMKSCGRAMLHGSGGRGKSASVFQPRKYVNNKQPLQKGNGGKGSTKNGNGYAKNVNESQEEDEIEDEFSDVNHQNYLLILLTHSERCWSAAMHVKTQYDALVSSPGGRASSINGRRAKTTPGKLRKQFLSKLCKASHYAATLHSMAHSAADESAAVECLAYTSWMSGNYALETFQWEMATREYGTCLKIVNALSQSSADDLEMADYFTSRGEYTIQPLYKYCQYELVQSGGAASHINMQDILSSGSFDEGATSTLLTSKLNEKRNETRRAQVSQMDSKYSKVVYRDVTFQVENEELRVLLCKLDETKDGAEGDEEDKDSAFTILLSTYDDAISVVTKDIQALEQLASGKQVNASKHIQACLKGYFHYQKLSALMQRNEGIVRVMELNEEVGGNTKRAEDLAHMYSVLLQNAKEITLLPLAEENCDANDTNDAADVEDEFGLEASAHVLRLRALKSFYAAQVHAQVGKVRGA